MIQDMCGKVLLENKGYVTKCLTDDCNHCTGSYINVMIQHRIICNCKCHTYNHQGKPTRTKDKGREEKETAALAAKES